ncbi:hypothetical protein [Dyella sp. 2HG41-7]|uniref:hypothetical protein n=1 Tax=Dyella sp. 2HG41-7 TaxID=2883239 RepID=UPI001F3AC3A3|nr:hypothetical protein [Dyella sp. 2HG41-7]
MEPGLDVMLSVYLEPPGAPCSLGVKSVEILPNTKQPQRIVWTLQDAAAAGSFIPLDQPEPGFAWLGNAPKVGIFTDLRIDPRTPNQMTILDNHRGLESEGNWSYVLRATIGGKIYSTILIVPSRAGLRMEEVQPVMLMGNPTIKNT